MSDTKRIDEALKKAYRYLKYRERSKYEVEKKLKNEGFENEVIEQVMGKLLDKNIVNDKRFTRMYVEDSLNVKKKGPYRIEKELKNFGIEEYLITDTLKDFQNEFLETLRSLVKNYAANKSLNEKELLKLKKKLYRRGFWVENIESEFERQGLE
ncbi:MAG: RecX family transcriptional regulator [Kosmotogaceae bacterium]